MFGCGLAEDYSVWSLDDLQQQYMDLNVYTIPLNEC